MNPDLIGDLADVLIHSLDMAFLGGLLGGMAGTFAIEALWLLGHWVRRTRPLAPPSTFEDPR